MPARKSAPKQDKTEQPLFPTIASATVAPDGVASAAEYNRNNGRKPNAPTSGGDRQATYDALLDKGAKRVPAAYLG